MDNLKSDYEKECVGKWGHRGHYCYSTIMRSRFTCKMLNNKLILVYENPLNAELASCVVYYCPFCGFSVNRLENVKWEGSNGK